MNYKLNYKGITATIALILKDLTTFWKLSNLYRNNSINPAKIWQL